MKNSFQDDGLLTAPIGVWSKEKYNLVSYYASLFATSMMGKWDCRVYIDLFSGSGRGRIKHTSEIVLTSPLRAIEIPDQFDKYLFCDKDSECIKILKNRIDRDFPNVNAYYICGDSNNRVTEIFNLIPKPSHSFTVLTFCFVDPFALSNLKFKTIKALSRLYIDFLILIPSYMDAHRNLSRYLNPSSTNVENFIGLPGWRTLWHSVRPGTKFGGFIADQFGNQMKSLGYTYSGLQDTVLVRDPRKNIPLYRLAFFCRNPLGVKFWNQSRKNTQAQISMFE